MSKSDPMSTATEAVQAAQTALEAIDARLASLHAKRAQTAALIHTYSTVSGVTWQGGDGDSYMGTSQRDPYGRALGHELRSILADIEDCQRDRQDAHRATVAAENRVAAIRRSVRMAEAAAESAALDAERDAEKQRRHRVGAERTAALRAEVASHLPQNLRSGLGRLIGR